MAQLTVLQAYCFHTERLLNNSISKVFRVVESFSVSVELCKHLSAELQRSKAAVLLNTNGKN